MKNTYDVVIIGGGFYGLMIALHLKKRHKKILIIEKNKDVLRRASYNNQARIHNGYHYPRSYITAYRSHRNYNRFINDFSESIYSDHTKYYAIAKDRSKVTPSQFYNFCKQVGSSITEVNKKELGIIDEQLIDAIFQVEEKIFDANKLKNQLLKSIHKEKIDIHVNRNVKKVDKEKNKLCIKCDDDTKVYADNVYNATYSGINTILQESEMPILPFKFELVEMPLISVSDKLKNISITVMDGPFFGFLPFPDQNAHSLYHVRYAIHATWLHDEENKTNKSAKPQSRYRYMIKDAQRFIPELSHSEYLSSLYEVRTVLQKDEFSDGRPILYKKDYVLKGYNIVMGGKIDNIYDILEKLDS